MIRDSNGLIDNFQTIVVESPVDKIIKQLRLLIANGQLEPGERLPSERKLSEKFGVGRSYVREAIRKLEFYGLLKTSPQSGTYVSGYNITILEGLLTDIINLNTDNFSALVEARYYLELDIVKLAAERRTEEDIVAIREVMESYEEKVTSGIGAVEEDLYFHFRIANASKNPIFKSMMLILLPDIIRYTNEKKICGKGRSKRATKEHKKILEAIADQSPESAEKAMMTHLAEVMKLSRRE